MEIDKYRYLMLQKECITQPEIMQQKHIEFTILNINVILKYEKTIKVKFQYVYYT